MKMIKSMQRYWKAQKYQKTRK